MSKKKKRKRAGVPNLKNERKDKVSNLSFHDRLKWVSNLKVDLKNGGRYLDDCPGYVAGATGDTVFPHFGHVRGGPIWPNCAIWAGRSGGLGLVPLVGSGASGLVSLG